MEFLAYTSLGVCRVVCVQEAGSNFELPATPLNLLTPGGHRSFCVLFAGLQQSLRLQYTISRKSRTSDIYLYNYKIRIGLSLKNLW